MFCKNCGKEIDNATKFCPECGTPVSQAPVEQTSQKTKAYIPEMPETSAPVATPKKKWLIPVIIAAVIVILGGIFAGLYFGTDLFNKEVNQKDTKDKKVCESCDKELTKKQISYQFTDEDSEETYYYCEDCDTGNYCEDCGRMLDSDDDAVCTNCEVPVVSALTSETVPEEATMGAKAHELNETDGWEDMTIRVAGYRKFNDDPLNYEFAKGAEEFTKKYGTTVDFVIGGGDGRGQDLVASIVGGDPWQIQYCFGISVFPLTFTEELYTPIDDYIDHKTNDMIDEITVEGATWLGKHYGISSLPMQEMWYIAYNETWMKELGLKTPHEYYEDGEWTMENYKKLNAEAVALGAKTRSSFTRPHTASRYISEWDEYTGEVQVTYDRAENYSWLSFWGDLLTDPQYNIKGGGRVSQRNCIMRDEVMPNLLKDELSQETTDVIRYIHFPNPYGELGTYLTDSHFLFPTGISEEELPCAVMLASYMTDMKSKICAQSYQANMTAEDWALFEDNMNNAYYLPRIFYDGVFAIGNTFNKDMAAGKAVSTHIAENTESLKAKAEEFNNKYIYAN